MAKNTIILNGSPRVKGKTSTLTAGSYEKQETR